MRYTEHRPMGFLVQLREQLRTIYLGMSWGRRALVLAVAVLCLAGVVGLVVYSSQPDYRVLYSGLAAEDAGAVTAKLQARSIPYKLGAGGTTVLVAADQVAQLRL